MRHSTALNKEKRTLRHVSRCGSSSEIVIQLPFPRGVTIAKVSTLRSSKGISFQGVKPLSQSQSDNLVSVDIESFM